jgi:hypothetical protein
MKRVLHAIEKAAAETTHFMQRDLRASALKHGWDRKVVNDTQVKYAEGKFSVHVSEKHGDAAFVHEFGDDNRPPTGVIRKFNNHTGPTEKTFLTSLAKHLGGKL